MPATFDATANGSVNGGAASITFAITVANQQARYLGLGISGRAGQDFTGATANGVAMTILISNVPEGGAKVSYAYLVAPDVGTYNIVVSFADLTDAVVCAWSAYWVDQSSPHTDSQSAEGSGGTGGAPTITLSSADGELGLAFVGFPDSAGATTLTPDATWTTDVNAASGAGNSRAGCGAHKAGASSLTWSGTMSNPDEWVMVGVSLKAAPPTITAVTPNPFSAGQSITISGFNF